MKAQPQRRATRKKRAPKKVFAVTETNLDAKAKGMVHDPKPCGCAKSGDPAPEDKGHTKGRPGHYTYI